MPSMSSWRASQIAPKSRIDQAEFAPRAWGSIRKFPGWGSAWKKRSTKSIL
jgi:hypothetical protein